MSQLNLQMTATFERNLKRYMKLRGIKTKSEAVRAAVAECLERAERRTDTDFRSWIGLGVEGQNPNPRFRSEDDLW